MSPADLCEIDLQRLEQVRTESFPSLITALSAAHPGLPLTVSTARGLHLHNLRTRGRLLTTADIIDRAGLLKNRQTSAHSKILSVVIHGTRLALSDSSGNIKWFEGDGLTEVRRHRISYGDVAHQSSILSTGSDDLARKILSTAASSDPAAFNNGDILFWTGEKLGYA
ncbi:hypothetical protein B0T16DRAFT_450993 [Cercophora newfieldiana]|uniref:Uncharacterized protein n=1 Tax=Cercophora newfieldiana TaxID=92897 RepID=A0AA40CXL0_9PEZI|nr:hypothetical protein B0T16DRAFT_450993 [Cercophora newfieldiana]